MSNNIEENLEKGKLLIKEIRAREAKEAAEDAVRDSAVRMRDAEHNLLFFTFFHERIRLPITIEERKECFTKPITTNRIKTVFSEWRKNKGVHILASNVIERLAKMFGEPINGKDWVLFKVFGNDEDVEEWDAQKSTEGQSSLAMQYNSSE